MPENNPQSSREFFNPTQLDELKNKIIAAEKLTSAEIRLHLTSHYSEPDLWDYGLKIFDRLGIAETSLRNGVLVVLVTGEQKEFGIFADTGIHQQVGQDFWNLLRDDFELACYNEDYFNGIVELISNLGQRLGNFFPYQTDDINELPDDISFGH